MVYLLSSFNENPENFFQGYCFIGNDYITGESGAKLYVKRTNNSIESGNDGCYVVAKKENDGSYIIGSDQSGYKKIFYYKNTLLEIWVVSNSINAIVEHLSSHGIKVTPNLAQISIMQFSESKNYTQQMVSFDTIVNEIKLLPLNTILKIGKKTLQIFKNDNNEINNIERYECLFKDFVETWVSRFATLLSKDMLVVKQDLTGGMDSRAIFSIFYLASNYLNNDISSKHYLISKLTRGSEVDIEVAQDICKKYGFDLNNVEYKKIKNKKLTNKDNYLIWKDICLGIYRPIYFPIFDINPFKISINGGGGENHRPFYAKDAKPGNPNRFELYNNQFNENLNHKFLGLQLKNNINNSMAYLKGQEENRYSEGLNIHYRNFRNRIHCGLNPQYMVCFTPLSCKLLDKIASKDNLHKISSSQILYDLISLVDDLIDIPFDKPQKNPSSEHMANLIEFSANLDISIGQVYIGDITEDNEISTIASSKSTIFFLKEDFDKACENNFVKEFWGPKYIESAKNTMSKAINAGGFNHGLDGAPISAIISTGIFT